MARQFFLHKSRPPSPLDLKRNLHPLAEPLPSEVHLSHEPFHMAFSQAFVDNASLSLTDFCGDNDADSVDTDMTCSFLSAA